MKWSLRPLLLSFYVMFMFISFSLRFFFRSSSSPNKLNAINDDKPTMRRVNERKSWTHNVALCPVHAICLCGAVTEMSIVLSTNTHTHTYSVCLASRHSISISIHYAIQTEEKYYCNRKFLDAHRTAQSALRPQTRRKNSRNQLKIWRIDKTRQDRATRATKKAMRKIARFSSFMWMMWRVESDTWHSMVSTQIHIGDERQRKSFFLSSSSSSLSSPHWNDIVNVVIFDARIVGWMASEWTRRRRKKWSANGFAV